MLQILNGTIDPSWIVVVLAGIVAFFFVRTLNKIDARMDQHEIRAKIITNVLLQMLTHMGGGDEDNDFYNDLKRQLNEK